MAFSYRYGTASACKSAILEQPLNNPSWSWGTGRWHHVAATYTPPISPAKGTLALYWDGRAAIANGTPEANIRVPMTALSGTLYIGSNAIGANTQDPSTNADKFVGNMDELALFKQTLSEEAIAAFSLGTTTVPGPAGCRWRVAEMRDESVSKWGLTSAAWNCYGDDALAITVTDGDWGSGVAAARLAPPGQTREDLGGYSHINLHAKIPAAGTYNGDFEVTLHAGDDSCTWFETLPPGAVPDSWYWRIHRVLWQGTRGIAASPYADSKSRGARFTLADNCGCQYSSLAQVAACSAMIARLVSV